MKTVILLLALVFSISTASAQDDRDTTAYRASGDICLGAIGDASLFSLNIEAIAPIDSMFAFVIGFGVGFNPGDLNTDNSICIIVPTCKDLDGPFITFPAHITFNIGKGVVCSEFGLGAVMISGKGAKNGFIYPTLGFRVLPFEPRNLAFRIYIDIPMNNIPDYIKFIPVGISFGLSF